MADKYTYNKETNELFAKGEDYYPYPGGLGKLCFDKMKTHASTIDLIAQIDSTTNEQQSYKEFFNRSVILAQYLRDSGIKPGDIIAICSYNHLNSAVVLTATLYIGAILAPTDPILTQEDTKYLLDMVKPKIVFVSNGCEKLIAGLGLPAKMIAFADTTIYKSFEGIISGSNNCCDFIPYFVDNLDATAILLFSSGTTGMPKAIQLSHHFFLAQMGDLSSITSNSKKLYLTYATLYWISSVYCAFISVQTGSTRLLCKQFNTKNHWDIVRKYKVNIILLSYTYTVEALEELKENMHLPTLSTIIIAGGLVTDNVIIEYNRKLPHVNIGHVYALTEAGLVSTYGEGTNISSSGKPVSNNQTIKIVDPESEEALPLNKVGEVRVKRKYQMTGYYKRNSSDAWDSQGFLKTGDLGYINDEFNVFVVDRLKEMFKYRSWHVVPAKIENILATMPSVLHAVVFGKPTLNEDENHAMAVVCLKAGAIETAMQIETFVNERLGEIDKIRAGVHIVEQDDFIFTPTGKINRRSMKHFAMALK